MCLMESPTGCANTHSGQSCLRLLVQRQGPFHVDFFLAASATLTAFFPCLSNPLSLFQTSLQEGTLGVHPLDFIRFVAEDPDGLVLFRRWQAADRTARRESR